MTFVFICCIGFLSSLGMTMGETLVSSYVKSLGALPSVIGFISSAVSMTSLLFTPLSSPLIDFFKKKYVYAIFTAIVGFSYIGYSFCTSIEMLFILRLINGIGKGVWGAAGLAMASDSLEEKQLTSGITYFTLAQAISGAIGPTVGLTLQRYSSYSFTFSLSALIILCFALLALKLNSKSVPNKKFSFKFNDLIAKEAVLLATMMVGLTLAYSSISSFLVVYSQEINIENIGLFLQYIHLFYWFPVL